MSDENDGARSPPSPGIYTRQLAHAPVFQFEPLTLTTVDSGDAGEDSTDAVGVSTISGSVAAGERTLPMSSSPFGGAGAVPEIPDIVSSSSGSARFSIGGSWGSSRSSRDSNNGEADYQNIGSESEPDLVYAYDDADVLSVELGELYSYSEIGDFLLTEHAFFDIWTNWCSGRQFENCGEIRLSNSGSLDSPVKIEYAWDFLNAKEKDCFAEFLLEQCERSEPAVRNKVLKAVLHLLQGCFVIPHGPDVLQVGRDNAFRFYRLGALQTFVQLLFLEADAPRNLLRTPALSIADSHNLRIICNILYHMIELIRTPSTKDTPMDIQLRTDFADDLGSVVFGKTIFIGHLFDLFMRYASGLAPHFPLKKILLLIWKTLLMTCGGADELRRVKNVARKKAGLPPVTEDTLEVAKRLRACTPPLSVSDMMEGGKGRQARSLAKYKGQPAKDADGAFWFTNVFESDDPPGIDATLEDRDDKEDLEVKHIEHPTKRTDSHPEAFTPRPETVLSKCLPWIPKIREEDIHRFICLSREKYVGLNLPEDTRTLIGLPKPIEESIQVMQKYIYTSLSDVQTRKEEGISKYPMSQKEDVFEETPVERIYQALLPQIGNQIIGLLKVLLACSPTSKPKTESLNVLTDVMPETMPTTMIQTMKMGMDTNRHKEIIVKAISSTILLLLKHFKIGHVYQFETVSQHLVMANCMALILKFLNQNILGYVLARNEIPVLSYPSMLFMASYELTKEDMEASDQSLSWRNLHSCINLIRILNKIAKWKRSRILVLVLFKSAAILKRALRIRHPVMQLYTLKALKIQSKFLGRQWRRLNMKTMSAIYEKVRHRLMDDWAYGNVPEHEVKKVDCQLEERKMRVTLDIFNNRRYHDLLRPSVAYVQPGLEEFQPVDSSLSRALSMRVRLPVHFHMDYEGWLEREVFQSEIDWDQLIDARYIG